MIRLTTFIIFSISIAFMACSAEPNTDAHLNQEVTIEGETMLHGFVDRDGFKYPKYAGWFNSTYQAYIPAKEILERIKSHLNNVHLRLYVATWCSDSRRDIPALFRILDDIGYNTNSLEIIALNRSMESPGGEEKGYNIEYVPTMIFYRDKLEIGRIVEFPNLTLEEDMLAIVSTIR
jgi:hypothetical protein